jgi:hypothetical protein
MCACLLDVVPGQGDDRRAGLPRAQDRPHLSARVLGVEEDLRLGEVDRQRILAAALEPLLAAIAAFPDEMDRGHTASHLVGIPFESTGGLRMDPVRPVSAPAE